MNRKGKDRLKGSRELLLCGFASLLFSCGQEIRQDEITSLPSSGGVQNVALDSLTQLEALWINEIDAQGQHNVRVNFKMSNPAFFGTRYVAEDLGQELRAFFSAELDFAMLTSSTTQQAWSSPFFDLTPSQASFVADSIWFLQSAAEDSVVETSLYFPESLSDLSEQISIDDPSGERLLSNCENAPLAAPLKWSASNETQSLTKIFLQISRVGTPDVVFEAGPLDDTGQWQSGLINGTLVEKLFSQTERDEETFVDELNVSILRRYVPNTKELKTSPRSDVQLLVQIQESKLMSFAYDKDCEI